jgi:hypothetical protein
VCVALTLACATGVCQVETALARRRQRLQQQPALFRWHGDIALDATHAAPVLQQQRLLETSGCSRLMHNLPLGTHIPTAGGAAGPAGCAGRVKHAPPPVSADATCAKLAAAEGARVVLASGAFRCFTDLLAEHEWEVPVAVRRLEGVALDGAPRPAVVFVDSPVLPARLSLRAKNALFYKARAQQRWRGVSTRCCMS